MKEESTNASSGRTKRRRTTTSGPIANSSSNKCEPVVVDIWKLEEEQAIARDVEKEYQLARQACGNVRRLLKEMLELKLSKGSSAEKREKRIHFLMLILTLKKFNRLEKIHNKRSRDLTNEVKAKADAHHLKLLNLLYEITHLTKEVNKCLEFKSRDEDIKLISVDEFYQEAPMAISKATVTKNDIHSQTLARLDYELVQRKRLASKYKQSEASKEQLFQEIKSKEEYLDSLSPSLHTILQATIPVQERLGMKQETKRRQHKLAYLLPAPLFILYVKMNAYAEAWDDTITVAVEGDYDEAKAMQQPTEDNDEESGESDQEETQGENRYRRSTTDRLAEFRKKILTKHPLTVSSTFTCSGCTLKLNFFYLVTLDVITVKSELQLESAPLSPTIDLMTTDALLEYLFDNDSGNDTPNEANHYQLQRWGMDDFKTYIGELGRPFMWAQRLAGLEFIQVSSESKLVSKSTKPNSMLSGNRMDETIVTIKRRIKDRINLQKEICDLEQSEVSNGVRDFKRILSRLTSFVNIAWDDYKELNLTQEMIRIGIVDGSYFTFKATIERGSAKLTAYVAVGPHYPSTSPVLSLQLEWKGTKTGSNDSAIQDIEKEVNVFWEELMGDGTRDKLLSNQIFHLMICLDLYLETESGSQEYDRHIEEFPRDKNVVHFKSGRDRSKPYKYIKHLGMHHFPPIYTSSVSDNGIHFKYDFHVKMYTLFGDGGIIHLSSAMPIFR